MADIPFQPLPSVAKARRAARVDLPTGVKEALAFLDQTLREFQPGSFDRLDDVIEVFTQLKENQSHLEACLRAHGRSDSPHHYVLTLRKWLCDLSQSFQNNPQLLQACGRSQLESMALGLTACISLGHNNLFSTAAKKDELNAFLSLAAGVFKSFCAITDWDQHDHAGCDCNLHNLVSRLLKSGLLAGKDASQTELRTLMKTMSANFFQSLHAWRGKPDANLSGLLSSAEKRAGKYDNEERMVKRAGKAMVQLETLCDPTHQLLPLGDDDTGKANREALILDLAWLGGERAIAAYAKGHASAQVALSSLSHLHACLLKWGYLPRAASTRELLGHLLKEIARLAADEDHSPAHANLRSLSNFCGLLKDLTHRKQDALWDADSRPLLESACQALMKLLARLGPQQLDTSTAVPMFAFLRTLENWQARPVRRRDGQGQDLASGFIASRATVTTTTSTTAITTTTTATSAPGRATASAHSAGAASESLSAAEFGPLLESAAATLLQRFPPDALWFEREAEHLAAMRDILKWLQGKPALAASAALYLDELDELARGKPLTRPRPSPGPVAQAKPLEFKPRDEKSVAPAPTSERWAGGIVGAGALQKPAAPIETASTVLHAATSTSRRPQRAMAREDDWNDVLHESDPAAIEVRMQPRALPRKAPAKAGNDASKGAAKHTQRARAPGKVQHAKAQGTPGAGKKPHKSFDEELAEARLELGIADPCFNVETFQQQNAQLESDAPQRLPGPLLKSLAQLSAGKLSPKNAADIVDELRLSAANGNALARYRLGLLLLQGRFIAQDHELAVQNLMQAGRAGFSPAWLAVARLYQIRPELGPHEAFLEAAADYGHPEAIEERNNARSEWEQPIVQPPTPAQLPSDLFHAISSMSKKRREGSADPVLEEAVIKQLKELAAKDNASAHVRLGFIYSQGTYAKLDLDAAAQHYRRAGELGDGDAWFDLALLHDREDRKNPVEFMKCLEAAAALDNPDALLALGREYEDGIIVRRDIWRAFEYWLRGANMKNAASMLHLGLCYLEGEGTVRDPAQASTWLQSASGWNPIARYKLAYLKQCLAWEAGGSEEPREQGLELLPESMVNLLKHLKEPSMSASLAGKTLKKLEEMATMQPPGIPNASALFQLALMRQEGVFFDKDDALALKLLKDAAELGLPAALYKLGQLARNNNAPGESRDWFENAAYNGHAAAWNELALQASGTDADSQQKAFRYWSRGARAGDPECQLQAGLCWLEGRGTGIHGKNAHKGQALIVDAARAGHAPAIAKLKTLPVPVNFNDGYGESARHCPATVARALSAIRDEDYPQVQRKQTLESLKKEATNKRPWAEHAMGRLLFEGIHVPQDLRAAASWFIKAQTKPPVRSQYYLGELYKIGTEVTRQNTAEALRHWKVGAADFDPDCLFRLGMAYLRGGDEEGVKQDYEQARKWFNLADQHGHPDAARELAQLERTNNSSVVS